MGRGMIERLRGRNAVPLVRIGVVLAFLLAGLLLVTPRLIVMQAPADLLQTAAQQPDASMAVIVQKWVYDDSLERLVTNLGGDVTGDLRIINAFTANVPGRAMAELAKAPGVRWVSLDAPMTRSAGPDASVSTGDLVNIYNSAIGADRLWAQGYQGSSVTVAVVDSGVAKHDDLRVSGDRSSGSRPADSRVVFSTNNYRDSYGHGTFVAGVIGGNGSRSDGAYVGVAPKVRLIDVDVADAEGKATESAVVRGLQWVYNNRRAYDIKVLNLSMNGTVAASYQTSPLDAALEVLWFNRIVVVVSAGNNGSRGILYPPANDPFVITVGAVNDRGTATTRDDVLASYSAFGTTADGVNNPDLVAPGSNIISLLANARSTINTLHPDHRVNEYYFRLSGTSVSSAVTTGAVALLLQSNPSLTPDQVKYRLKATARPFGPRAGAGYLDVYAAVQRTTRQSANTGIAVSPLLRTGSDPLTWDSLNWDSLNWDSLNWDSVNWDSLNWDSLNWDSDYWGQ